uniref:Protein kinase domain-containing protein n=1 Tax=Globisporangium ultimum (strain ATCC 200006 / CBS 805.95 / DAOM BR144) TaxID=431595 RepID=K3X8C7_GLOUD
MHYTKSGKLDMRYSSSRAAVAASPSASSSSSSYSAPRSSQPTSSSHSAGVHFKKDGTPDMRYSSSRAAVASSPYASAPPAPSYPSNTSSNSRSSNDLHYKKDGTLDMRYTSSQVVASRAPSSTSSASANSQSSKVHYKKDSTLDLRYTSSKLQQDMDKLNVSKQQPVHLTKQGVPDRRTKEGKAWGQKQVNTRAPAHVPLTNRGLPNMRTVQGKAWVEQQAAHASASGELPDWLPRKKDNSLDYSSALLKSNVLASQSTDVYSFGVLLNELIQEEEPYYESFKRFHGKGPFAVVQHARNGGRPVIHASKTSAELTALIEQCWHKDATKRPSFDELARRLCTMEFANSC